jgi:serine/threonine protein kinase
LKHPNSPQFHATPTVSNYGASLLNLKQVPQSGSTGMTSNSSSLDITGDTEASQESPVSTPFQFTSFPASLPRVYPRPRDGTATMFCPNTIRKKVSYQSRLDATMEQPDLNPDEDVTALKRSRPMTVMHYSVDDAAAQNSSVSGTSGEHPNAVIPQNPIPSFPPPDLDWKSVHLAQVSTRIDSADNGIPEHGPTVTKRVDMPSGLFLNTPNHGYSYSEDDESPARTNVARTRLDFNLVLSPTQGDADGQEVQTEDLNPTAQSFELSKRFSERRVNNYLSMSPTTTSQQTFGTESTVIASTMSPMRPHASSSMLERPASPAEVQFRFRLDAAQCSPILPPGMIDNNMDVDHTSPPSDQLSPVAECQVTRSASSVGNTSSQDDSKLSVSQDSSSSCNSSKQRRLRPMPDMSAFDAGASVRSGSSLNNKSGADDSVPSPKLACPPTPVRTPAWAHNDGATNIFVRANSLNVTKVLATCPVQVVDGHSSLENSMDLSGADIERRQTSLSFSPLDMERGDEVMEDAHDQRQRYLLDAAVGITPLPRKTGQLLSVPRFSLKLESLTEFRTNPKEQFAPRVLPSKPAPINSENGASISFATSFENLGELGSGAFGDVYKVRSKTDGQLYAVKRNRRQFRGKRDRDMAMAEVRTMQKLQSVCADIANKAKSYSLYVLFFYRAWQEEGFFYCQTELCCRDTCRDLMDSLRSKWQVAVIKYPSLTKHLPGKQEKNNDSIAVGRLMPDMTVWKICHDVAAGLSHIHSHGIVHHDIKPSNIFFVSHARLGAMCKIGDFGMAGEIGTAEDGQEGDTVYMAPELLSSSEKQPSADIFSLGLTLYELASDIGWQMPFEGPRWHEVRGGHHVPELPPSRHFDLVRLIQAAIRADQTKRPSADEVLNGFSLVKEAGSRCDEFLRDYLLDIERNDREREVREALLAQPEQTPRNSVQREVRTPTPGMPLVPFFFTPNP